MSMWQVYQDIQGSLSKVGQAYPTETLASAYRAQLAAQETYTNQQRAAQGLPPITFVVKQV